MESALPSFLDWRRTFNRIFQITKDNKLRQFLNKILHRIIITKKELKQFNIAADDHCNFCNRPDSILHTFLECDVSISLFSSTIKWFNTVHKLNVSFCWTNFIQLNGWNNLVDLPPKAQTGSSLAAHEVRFLGRTPIFLNFKPNSNCNGKSNISHKLDFAISPFNIA